MLKDGTIIPIQSPYASPVMLCRKNNGLPLDNLEAYRFSVDYRKLNVITKYPRYPLPLIDDFIMNIPHTGIMSALDLRSGYFQMAVNPSDIVKTAFVTKNGKFVSVYMDDVIISSPSFTQHVKHLKEVFRLLYKAGLTLNKDKCKFGCEELKYLGLIINKEGIKADETKVQAIVEMKPPYNSKEVSKFLGMSQWEILGIRHVKTVVYVPQANRTERVNRDLVQMIANYVNEQHDTLDQFLREFDYAIHTAKLVMVSDGTEFAVGDIERLFEEARRNTRTKQEKWKKYYNRSWRDVQIKVNNCVLVATHSLSSATRIVVAKFKPKFEGPYRVLDVKNNNVVIWKAGKRFTINVDQSKNERLAYKRSHESRSGGPERKVQKGSEHRVNKRALPSNYRTNHSLTKFRKKSRREETVTPTTSGYNLRPRIGKREESRPTIDRKTQQGGPSRSRKGRERNDSPYIEERTRSSNKNARRGVDQQRQDQERRGTCTKKSLSLEVLVGNANYKS
ncbi:retrovirus-related Pol polyprotein from transposon opus [Trichonephila clavipes]|nr:retrovirus-related Pol polyprotein from transposon opus [Trichonephila clavipes]